MKKRKTPELLPVDFKNTPFKALKGLAPRLSSSVGKPKTAPAAVKIDRIAETEDDASLFLRTVEGVRRIGPGPEVLSPTDKTKVPAAADAGAPPDNEVFLHAMKKIGTTFREQTADLDQEEHVQRSSSSRMRQLKRGTIRISQELDLHGFLKDEALMRLEHFIGEAYRTGQQAVLIITGKGLNSPEGPVLQGAVAAWLRNKGKGMLAEFSPAPHDRGGSGAYVVFIKKQQNAPSHER